jgi:AcrR family transcriptional regulator
MSSATPTGRRTAEERRETVVEAALTEFASHGFDGASTDTIARNVGISQPYLFRLFGTKKQLFLASIERCMGSTLMQFQLASEGLTGEAALAAMGRRYWEMIATDPRVLRGQMQAYVACEDPDVREVVQRSFGRLVEHVEGLGVTPEQVAAFFARGMLINVLTAMDATQGSVPWADRILATFKPKA